MDATVHWAGGYQSHSEIVRPVSRIEQLRDGDKLFERILQLRDEGKTSPQIAAQLNQDGYCTPQSRSLWKDYQIRRLLRHHGFARWRLPETQGDQLGENEWWIRELADKLNIPRNTLTSWRIRGWITARQLPGVRGRWVLFVDEGELERLRRLRECPRGWHDEPYPPELTTPRRPEES